MNNNQKGFGAVEILLVLVVVGLLVGAGWYFIRNDSKELKSSTAEQVVEMKPYTDSAKLYSLSYPSTWTVKEAGDCCEGEPKDYTKASRSVTIIPSNKAEIHGYGVNVQADSTESLAKNIEQHWNDNKHEPEPKTINGYSARYVKVTFSGDAENYIDHNYLITHNGANVFVTFREKYYHQYPAEDWSASQDMHTFNKVLNSVTFLSQSS
ncbi:MAG TPA: PsbP-related protein [Candidatus Saccharimonadales bacterium]|nr:PsbP-related protein [Candidatus Saccharimonadales bacterium]